MSEEEEEEETLGRYTTKSSVASACLPVGMARKMRFEDIYSLSLP